MTFGSDDVSEKVALRPGMVEDRAKQIDDLFERLKESLGSRHPKLRNGIHVEHKLSGEAIGVNVKSLILQVNREIFSFSNECRCGSAERMQTTQKQKA